MSTPSASSLALGRGFAFILATAVWMHLDEAERREAMQAVAALLAPGGTIALTLRHGPMPKGRRMFEVTSEETIALAAESGLKPILERRNEPSSFAWNEDVTCSRVAFARAGDRED